MQLYPAGRKRRSACVARNGHVCALRYGAIRKSDSRAGYRRAGRLVFGRFLCVRQTLFQTAYRPYAAVWTEWNVVGTPAVGEIFTTLEAVAGSATVEAAYDKYFDGDEIVAAEYHPMRREKRIFPQRFTSSAEAAHWYVALYTGDYTDPGAVFRTTIINGAEVSGREGCREDYFHLLVDTQCTSRRRDDASGNVGKIFRWSALHQSGASPISELSERRKPRRRR